MSKTITNQITSSLIITGGSGTSLNRKVGQYYTDAAAALDPVLFLAVDPINAIPPIVGMIGEGAISLLTYAGRVFTYTGTTGFLVITYSVLLQFLDIVGAEQSNPGFFMMLDSYVEKNGTLQPQTKRRTRLDKGIFVNLQSQYLTKTAMISVENGDVLRVLLQMIPPGARPIQMDAIEFSFLFDNYLP